MTLAAATKQKKGTRTDILNGLMLAPFLSGVPKQDLEVLAQASTWESYEANNLIVREGDAADRLWVVVKGTARVVKYYRTTKQQVIAEPKGVGDIFGEMALLEGHPRFATVIANGHLELVAIPYVAFVKFIESHVDVWHQMSGLMSRKLRETQECRMRELERQSIEMKNMAHLHRVFQTAFASVMQPHFQNAILSASVLGKQLSTKPQTPICREAQNTTDDLVKHLSASHGALLNLGDFARFIGGQRDILLQDIDAAPLANMAVSNRRWGPLILKTDIPDKLPLRADRRRLGDAMHHLLTGSMQYANGNRSLLIRLHLEKADDEDRIKYQIGKVSDKLVTIVASLIEDPHILIRSIFSDNGVPQGMTSEIAMKLTVVNFVATAHRGALYFQGNEIGFWIPRIQKSTTHR